MVIDRDKGGQGTCTAMPTWLRLKKMFWSRQAASQAALLERRERRLLMVSRAGTTRWMKVATSAHRPSGRVSSCVSFSASKTSPCTPGRFACLFLPEHLLDGVTDHGLKLQSQRVTSYTKWQPALVTLVGSSKAGV